MNRTIRIRVAVTVEPFWCCVPAIESLTANNGRMDKERQSLAGADEIESFQTPVPRLIVLIADRRAKPDANSLAVVDARSSHVCIRTDRLANGRDDAGVH